MPVKSLSLNSIARHAVVPAAAFLLAIAVFFVIRWYLGNAISARVEQTERVPPRELAQLAARWAPADPQTHYAMAVLDEKSFRLEDVPRALGEFEQATALSPNDYRLWLALGQARDRAGETDGAIAALRQALRLAPHYAPVQWALGNALLRGGAEEEAFALIRRAVESDAKFTEPALAVLWQWSGGNLSRITQAMGDSAQVKSVLSVFLAKQKLYEQAFASWNALAGADKKETFRANTDELFKQLLSGKKYRDESSGGRKNYQSRF
jgi:tetratricopeptide (TPR) repeat protein